jgi:hypothetical protein
LIEAREAINGIEPRVERSETRGFRFGNNKTREATDGLSAAARIRELLFIRCLTLGFAPLHPGLYAAAVFDG